MILRYCFSLPTPPRISLLGPYHEICGLYIVSAPGKLRIYACLCRSNAHESLPTDVPPALIQATVTRTFAKPAVNLSRLTNARGPSKCRHTFDQQALYRIPRIVQKQTLSTAKGFIRSSHRVSYALFYLQRKFLLRQRKTS